LQLIVSHLDRLRNRGELPGMSDTPSIFGYKTIYAVSAKLLDEAVNEQMKTLGWEPWGSPYIDGGKFHQAMVERAFKPSGEPSTGTRSFGVLRPGR
jgi:hypothetical protein